MFGLFHVLVLLFRVIILHVLDPVEVELVLFAHALRRIINLLVEHPTQVEIQVSDLELEPQKIASLEF